MQLVTLALCLLLPRADTFQVLRVPPLHLGGRLAIGVAAAVPRTPGIKDGNVTQYVSQHADQANGFSDLLGEECPRYLSLPAPFASSAAA